MFRNLAWVCVLLSASGVEAGQNVVVVLDDSSSMTLRMRSDRRVVKIDAAKRALLSVLEKLPPGTKVGVVALNGRWDPDEWIYPLGPVDKPRLRASIERIQAYGNTPLGACMKVGADALLALRAKQHYGTYRLLVVTDGEATDRPVLDAHLPDLLSRGLWVDVIGVDMAANHSLANRVQTYRRADDPASLQRAIADVFAESSGTAKDADVSDFELIAPIPSQMAAEALAALAQVDNQPIGDRPMPPLPAAGPPPTGPGPGPGPAPPGAAGPASVPPPPPQGGSGWPWLGSGCFCCTIGLVLLVAAVVAVSRMAGRSR